MRWFAVLSTAAIVAGLVLAFTGSPLLGALLFILGLLGEAIAFVASEARRLYGSAQEWIGLFTEGRPRSLRLVSVEPPRGFVFSPDATVTLEIEGGGGTTRQHEQGVPVPRLYAFFWKLATWLKLPLPKRLDFERMVRLQLRRAEAEARPPLGATEAA
jgi:hypothetical protein